MQAGRDLLEPLLIGSGHESLRAVADNVAQGLELLGSTTGVDLAELLKGITRRPDAGRPEPAAANGKVEITG